METTMSSPDPEPTTSRPTLPGRTEPLPDGRGASLWSVADDRLRGRWTITIIVGFLLAAILAPIGYLSTKPKYHSVGLIRIAPKISPVLRETAETRPVPLYTSFVRTQATLVASRRVLKRALEDKALSDLDVTVSKLKRGVTVEAERNTELIAVRFESESPMVAQTSVNAILDAYYEIFGSADSDEIQNKLRMLRDIQLDRRRQIREKERQLLDHANSSEYGAVDLSTLIRDRVAQVNALETQISQIKHVLNSTTTAPAEDAAEDGSRPPSEPTAQQLADMDPELARLRSAWAATWNEFHHAQENWKPAHPRYQRIQEELDLLEERIRAREAIVRPKWEAAQLQKFLLAPSGTSMDAEGSDTGQGSLLTRRQIEVMLQGLENAAAQARRDVKEMFGVQQRRDEIRNEREYLEQDLAEIDDRIMHLEVEEDSVRTGRISIAARGHLASSPSRDRRPELAAVGAVGGFGLSFGFFFLLGTLDRRAYRAAQLRGGRIPRCLGVLPDLGRERPDLDTCAVAAHCVHQIRNHIEVLRDERSAFVLAVSSPYPGDGKTNIVMALGWSFATAGNRTLLVDCDFTGTSLTQQMGMSGQPGLKEALREGNVNGHVLPHRIPQLSVLPVGLDADIGPEMLRRADLKDLFAQLRSRFDVVIVDTGPLLASLEGIPVVSAADNTILSIRRGRRQALLEECTDRLNDVGASCLGLVLNYAARGDCNRYVSKSSISVRRAETEHSAGTLAADPPAADTGRHSALVQAMSDASAQGRVRRVPPPADAEGAEES
jgi:Mrp family chromosome partitioning ATPase/uncharacterized protein involved in exopolysaccharide biosynthesis